MKKLFAIILTFFISYLVFLSSGVSAKILNKELVNKVTLVIGYKVNICEVKISVSEVVSYSATASEISYFNNPTAVPCLAGDGETLVYGDVAIYLKDNTKVFDNIILYNDLILREDSLNFSYYDDGNQGGTFMQGDGTNPFTKVKFAQANGLHNTDPKLPGGQEILSDSGVIMHYNPTNGQVDSMLFAFKGKVYKQTKVISQTSDVVLVDYMQESSDSTQKPPPSNQTDQTANWKTYTITPDLSLGYASYQIKLSTDWKQIEHSSNFQATETFQDTQNIYKLVIEEQKNYNDQTGKSFANFRELTGLPYDVAMVSIDGQQAARPLPRAGSEHIYKALFFSKDAKLVYSIALETPRDGSKINEGNVLFDQILSTFKFTSQ